MTVHNYFLGPGATRYLTIHLGNAETTLVTTDDWLVTTAEDNGARVWEPDLLLAFYICPELYGSGSGYISSEQGTPGLCPRGGIRQDC